MNKISKFIYSFAIVLFAITAVHNFCMDSTKNFPAPEKINNINKVEDEEKKSDSIDKILAFNARYGSAICQLPILVYDHIGIPAAFGGQLLCEATRFILFDYVLKKCKAN